jgi:hypothetical protein
MILFVVAAVLLVLVLVSTGVGWVGMIDVNIAEQKKQKKAVRSFLTESRCLV